MSIEKVKSADTVTSGLVAGTRSGDNALALGRFKMACYDKDGALKWEAEEDNLVVNVGLQYMAGVALTSTTQITSWFIGLYGAYATNTPAAGDTLAVHPGWVEVTPYAGSRPAITFVAATLNNPSVVTNSSVVAFAINATQTVGGAFLCSVASGTSGTLFSAADFTGPLDRNVISGDTLNVTYTLSLAG
jgi:hypothetical protein